MRDIYLLLRLRVKKLTPRYYKLSSLLLTFLFLFSPHSVIENMELITFRRDCSRLGSSILPLVIFVAVSAVIASPHPKPGMNLNLYGQDDYSIAFTPANLDTSSSDFFGQGEMLESKCAPDGIQNVGKVRRMVPCADTETSGQVETDQNNGKTAPVTGQDEDSLKTLPPVVQPTEQKHQNPPETPPEISPELGPLYVPTDGYEIRGPCQWPLRFLCCSGTLPYAFGDVNGCWLCM